MQGELIIVKQYENTQWYMSLTIPYQVYYMKSNCYAM